MTLKRIAAGSGHRYELDGVSVPGVTTILKAFPKDALVGWAADESAGFVLNRWDELVDMQPSERYKAVRNARFTENRAATSRGKDIHAIGESLAKGVDVDVPERQAHLIGYAEAYARWLDAWDVTATHIETPIANRTRQYAGTADLLALIGGERWLLDLKTMKDDKAPDVVYPEHVLQVAAYRNGELALVDGEEAVMPEVDRVGIVNIKADGAVLVPVDAGAHAFRSFLHVYAVWDYMRTASDLVGALVHPLNEATVRYRLVREDAA